MKARPILMSAPMVSALLGGRKTQTRRIVKPQPQLSPHHEPVRAESRGGQAWVFMVHSDRRGYAWATGDVRCPYGRARDLLWARETWAQVGTHGTVGGHVRYRADEARALGAYGAQRWTPSIYMPRRVSRLTLRLLGVGVERLQEISEEDARAEGVFRRGEQWSRSEDGEVLYDSARMAFCDLWCEINGRDSWNSNPWVWRLSFECIQRNVDDVLRDAREAA